MLSGFMFPFRGMPDWAQALGEIFPLTHFLRIVRAVMLKGAHLSDIAGEVNALIFSCSCLRRWRFCASGERWISRPMAPVLFSGGGTV